MSNIFDELWLLTEWHILFHKVETSIRRGGQLQFFCKFNSVYACQKLSEQHAVWQSYCKNKKGAFFASRCRINYQQHVDHHPPPAVVVVERNSGTELRPPCKSSDYLICSLPLSQLKCDVQHEIQFSSRRRLIYKWRNGFLQQDLFTCCETLCNFVSEVGMWRLRPHHSIMLMYVSLLITTLTGTYSPLLSAQHSSEGPGGHYLREHDYTAWASNPNSSLLNQRYGVAFVVSNLANYISITAKPVKL